MTLGQTTKSILGNWLRITQLSICFAVMVGCSSSEPTAKPETKKSILQQVKSDADPIFNSEYYLNKADEVDLVQGRQFRIKAAALAIQEQHTIGYIKKIVLNIDLDAFGTIDDDILLIKVLLHIKHNQEAETILTRLKQGELPVNYKVPMWLLTAQVSSYNDQHIDTVRTLFRIKNLYPEHLTSVDLLLMNEMIWKHIVQIPETSLNKFVSDFGNDAGSWVQLAKIVQNFISEPSQLPIELQRWYKNYAQFNNFDYLPAQIKKLIKVEPYAPVKIALLLPLSGSIATQAQTIRNGFLANIDFNDNIDVMIINTDIEVLSDIEQKIIEHNVEFIVGPLKKETITEFQTSPVLAQIPTLYLNSLDLAPSQNKDTEPQNATQFYFSLAPEDEIDQAVEYFIKKKVEYPALIHADNSLGRRLAEQFEQQWFLQTDKHIETVAFKNKTKLGVAVKNLLDVNYSEQRVKEMTRLFGSQLKTENRSRNDIDAIYVIANSQQTRLIKPFFDTNVSVFNKRLPIYASSRSYVIGESSSQKRDLNGLTFTEMPWLIRDTNQEATNIYNQVTEPHTQLKKLFAFGYDARHLIPLLKQLQILSGLEVTGLTGKLSLNKQNTIKRYLDWSRYQQGKIVVLKKLNQ